MPGGVSGAMHTAENLLHKTSKLPNFTDALRLSMMMHTPSGLLPGTSGEEGGRGEGGGRLAE